MENDQELTKIHLLDPNPTGSPAVLLLHGLGATADSWTLQITALTKAGYRPLAPDLPGFGLSIYDGKGWNIRRLSNLIKDHLEKIGIVTYSVIGLSMGGVIAQQICHQFPKSIQKLLLVSTFACFRPGNISEWSYFLNRFLAINLIGLPAQARLVSQRVFPQPDQESLRGLLIDNICSADPRAYKGAMRSLFFFDSRKWLSQIKQPTLIISGNHDTTISPRKQAELTALIPGSRQIILPNSGHAACVDQAEFFNEIMLEFLG
jgi:3-oxoadipate enol-lactonase